MQACGSNCVSDVLFSAWPTAGTITRWWLEQDTCVRVLEIAHDSVDSVACTILVAAPALNLIEEFKRVSRKIRIAGILFGRFLQEFFDEG